MTAPDGRRRCQRVRRRSTFHIPGISAGCTITGASRGISAGSSGRRTAPGEHIELHFGASFYQAHVWLNGVELGRHEGGFTAYSFDITAHLRATNLLVVRLDNRAGMATIPGVAARGGPAAPYDWWTYGGLVRDVWLTSSGPAWVRRQSIRTEQGAVGARIHDRIFLGSTLPRHTTVTLRVTAFGPDNKVAAQQVRGVTLDEGSSEVEVTLELAHPQLWDLDHPNLYRMVGRGAGSACCRSGRQQCDFRGADTGDPGAPSAVEWCACPLDGDGPARGLALGRPGGNAGDHATRL